MPIEEAAERGRARSVKQRERFRASALRASVGRCARRGLRAPGARPDRSDICKWRRR